MSPTSPSPRTTRLERLDLGTGGAAFALDGQPVRLHADAQAASVATLRQFYQPALADCYARAAALRPPSLFGRLRSWVGSLLSRFAPAPAAVPYPPPLPPFPEAPAPARPPAAAAGTRPAEIPEAASPRGAAVPPVLQLVFADREGVHLIWELGPPRREPGGAAAAPPRLVLTYHLDSAMAQRLQACYGQLAKLGYAVADLETIRPEPAKAPAASREPEPGAAPIPEPSPAVEPAAKPRRVRVAAPAQIPLVPPGPASAEVRQPAPALPEP